MAQRQPDRSNPDENAPAGYAPFQCSIGEWGGLCHVRQRDASGGDEAPAGDAV